MNDTFCEHGTHWHHACYLCILSELAIKAIEPCQGGIRFVHERTEVGFLTTIEHMQSPSTCDASCDRCAGGLDWAVGGAQ